MSSGNTSRSAKTENPSQLQKVWQQILIARVYATLRKLKESRETSQFFPIYSH